MITECSNCSGQAGEFCTRAYRVSAQKVAGPAEDLVISGEDPETALKIISRIRDHELSTLTYLSRAVLSACNLKSDEIERRLNEAIVEAGPTLSSS